MNFDKYKYGLLILLFSMNIHLLTAQEMSCADSLILQIETLAADTNKVIQMNDLVWKLRFEDKNKAIKLGKESFELAKSLDFDNGAAYATKNLGGVFFYAGQYDTAKIYYNFSLEYFEKLENKKGVAIAYRNIGNVFHQEGNWKVALDYYLKSLQLREELGDRKGVAMVNGAIGLLYVSSRDKGADKAIDYFRKSLETYNEIGDSAGMAESYLYIGNFFYDKIRATGEDTASVKINSDSALFYFQKAKHLNKKLQTPVAIHNIGTIDDAIGSVFIYYDLLDSAYIYFMQSYKVREATGNLYGLSGTSYNIGRYYSKLNKTDSSLFYFKRALDLSKQIGAKNLERDVSSELGNIYFDKKSYKKAAELYIKYNSLNDSLSNDESTKRMTELAMQYEFDKQKKEEELEQAKKDALHNAEMKQQKKIRNIFIGGFFIVILFAIYILKSLSDKKKANKKLAQMNNEILDKNYMLNQQKEEIIAQRDEIELQRDFVIRQRDKIAEQNKHITDSIVYAQRIQQAVMPPDEYFNKILHEYFILFKPRDIVSGDYYWATQKDNKIILTAADCTGHGVPGAFMSLLGISFLNEIVNKINPSKGQEVKANLILNQLRDTIKKSLRQTGKFTEAKDGMDMALCVIDPEEMKMQFAGANNPVLLIRDGVLTQYKPDKMPVGIHYKEQASFTNHEINIQKGDTIYMFSDGYIDQFGGEKGRKFMIKRFKELIVEIYDKPMREQKEILTTTFDDWKKGDENREFQHQIDDVLVIGFKV